MTRDEVARECEKLEWWLCSIGDRHFVVGDRGNGDTLAEADSPREAYLEACKREGKSPF